MNFNTDLADERYNIYKKANKIEDNIPGIETEEIKEGEDISTTRVKIIDKQGEDALGKPIGNYITIYIKNLKIAEEEEIGKAAEIVSKEIKELIKKHIQNEEEILVVGLGNIYVTPDSLRTKSGFRS